MSKSHISYYIVFFLLSLFVTDEIISQSYSYNPSKLYIHNMDTNSTDFGGIEILNTGTQNLNLNWRLQIVDTLIDSRFELCNSGICYLNLASSGAMPAITPGNIGWIKFHMYSGVATGTNTITYLLKNGSTTMDTLVFKIIVNAGTTGLNEIYNIEKISMFPNPTSNEAFVNFTMVSPNEVKLYVLNNIGQVVYNTNANLKAGSNKISINTKELPPGIYDVLIESGNGLISKKLSVTK
ncbi:MAG TPA: T9SS type A sorting domain-containing protein [Bacteroidia bacterium]|nr:T9SS type A sorting domain-containing protein [Bacteroidia bacterium]